MGKSFNDDVFNNGFNLDTINGLNISKEAIEENKEHNKIDDIRKQIKNINLDEVKKELQEEKKQEKIDPQQEYEQLLKEHERYTELEKEQRGNSEEKQIKKDIYVKKTMIFKQEYLDIIDGLAIINDMQIKDVLNQLLEKSINMLDDKIREKALKNGKKTKPVKQEKSIS